MKNFFKNYAGVLLAAAYALILRLVFNIHVFQDTFNLFSFTYLCIVPLIIGVIPFIYASKEQLDNWNYRFGSPMWSITIFFLLCFLSRIEDLVCIWILLIPYLFGAMVAGQAAAMLVRWVKNKRGTLYSLLALPLLISPIEQQFSTPHTTYSTTTRVVIQATPEEIWERIIRVSTISEKEYQKGFFNYAGIPRPLYAELDKDTIGATRIGHFEGGLTFLEKVSTWDRNKQIAFDITVVPESIGNSVFDEHVLRGNHFQFLNAAYRLTPVANGQTELSLCSSYELRTNVNAYGAYCGDQLLSDFQERLLEVIKKRCESNEIH